MVAAGEGEPPHAVTASALAKMMHRMGLDYTRVVRFLPAVPAVCAAACLSTPPADQPDASPDAAMCVDADDDGWRSSCPGDTYQDCDDGNPAIHPGAREVTSADAIEDRDCTGSGLLPGTGLVDLTAGPLGGGGGSGQAGARIATGFGRYDLDPRAGHQLTSVVVQLAGSSSAELLYDGPIMERNSGVHVWDDFLAVLPDDSRLDEVASGPAIYQALVTYRDGGTMSAPALAGTSLYTITMDGRIHRTDRLTLAAQPPYAGGADYPGITSFVALAASAAIGGATTFTNVVAREANLTLTSALLPISGGGGPQLGGGDPSTWRWSCAYGDSVEVGFTRVVPDNGQPIRAMRVYSSPGASLRQVALQYDWQQGTGNPVELVLASQRGHFLITPSARSIPVECSRAEAKSNAFTTPVDVVFGTPATGQLVTVVDDQDDDENDDGFIEAGGYWAVRALTPAGITLGFVQPGGTALPTYSTFRIGNLPANRDPVLLIDGVRASQGERYRLQPDGTAGIWLVIMVPLLSGQTVELVSPPG